MQCRFILLVLAVGWLLAPQASASDYQLHADGYYYAAGVPYTRTWHNAYYYYHNNCRYYQDGYYQYTPVKVVEKTVEKVVPQDWRTKLLELRKEQLEHQNYIDSIKFLGLDNPQKSYPVSGYGQVFSTIGTYGAQGNTQYGYSLQSFIDHYGDNNLGVLLQQLGRITENQQQLSGQATSDFGAIIGRVGQDNTRVAEILAQGQVAAQVLKSLQTPQQNKIETKEFRFKVGGDGKIESLPETLPAPKGDLFKTWQSQAQGCANCHFGKTLKGNFDISTWPSLSAQKKAEYAYGRLLTDDHSKLMTPTKTDTDPGKPLTEEDVLTIWMRVRPSK